MTRVRIIATIQNFYQLLTSIIRPKKQEQALKTESSRSLRTNWIKKSVYRFQMRKKAVVFVI